MTIHHSCHRLYRLGITPLWFVYITCYFVFFTKDLLQEIYLLLTVIFSKKLCFRRFIITFTDIIMRWAWCPKLVSVAEKDEPWVWLSTYDYSSSTSGYRFNTSCVPDISQKNNSDSTYTAMLPVSVIRTNLLSDNHICTITELHVHCVLSTGSTLITLVHIGLCNEIEVRKGATFLLYHGGKIAKRGRIDILY